MAADDANDLRRALENSEIIPYFQPLVELRTGLLRGFEALARWQHPQRGLILPNEFIPLAESSGLHGLLTGTLLRAVFAAAKDIPSHLTISVNISLTQLTDLTLPRHVAAAARQANFPLNRLVLEITESALVGNTETAARITHELKENGSRLSLDDFGTGYSSLRHLQLLPFDEIKIDASFVRSMNHTRESRKIAAAVVGLGNSLNLTTVAEGIETQAIADMLLWLGCDVGQGWLYGRPVPPERLADSLAEHIAPAPSHASAEYRSPVADASLPLRLEALPAQRLAQLNAIYDGIPVGLCFLDHNLRYVSVNKRLAEIHHLPVAAHLGRYVSEILPTIFPQYEPYLLRALEGEPSTGLEICYPDAAPNPAQEPCTHLVSFQPARDEVNEVIGISVSVVDISHLKRAEKALAESEDHYRNAVELNPNIPWTAEPDGLILAASRRFTALTGLTQEETLGTGWTRALHPDDLLPTLKAWEESLRLGNPIDVQYRVRRFDGVWRWMRARAAPRRNPEGKIIRWYGTLEDIDDHQKSEEALRRSEARLHAIFSSVPVGILIAEAPDGHIATSNPRAEEILRAFMVPSATIDDYFPPPQPESTHANLDRHPLITAVLGGRTVGPKEFLRDFPDGTSAWISFTASPILDVEGKVSGAVVVLRDIDEERRERDRLTELATSLKNRLATYR
jgi:PAS domain S-box-containing protein